MIGPLLAIGRYIPLDPNEGWNAYFADAAIHGGVLYPPADALITNNYPPLSFYIVGAIGHLTGDTIFAGPRARPAQPVVCRREHLLLAASKPVAADALGRCRRALTFLAFAVTYAHSTLPWTTRSGWRTRS